MCMNHADTRLFWMSVFVNASYYIAKRVTAVSPELQPQRDHPTFALFSQISSLLPPPLPPFLLHLPPPRVSLTECDSGVSRGAQVARLL